MAQNGRSPKGPRCIALVGPFQSGKTTLLEAILTRTGAVPRQGSVEAGTSVGDASKEARHHRMSVEVSVATAEFMGETYTFVDCPGSVEFAHDTRAVLPAIDAAVVVCELDEKKIPQLQLILRELEDQKIPHFLYLNKIDKIRGKTRVAGTLKADENEELDVANKKVWVRGKDKVYETTTDQYGVYEFYDLPPGRYVLAPEMPLGWKIDRSARYTTSVLDRQRQIFPKHIAFTLSPKSHAAIDVSFVLSTEISGRVVDPHGTPLSRVQVSLTPIEADNESVNFEYTDEKGRFAIESFPPGSYLLGLNDDGIRTIEEPFPTLFYPNVGERQKG